MKEELFQNILDLVEDEISIVDGVCYQNDAREKRIREWVNNNMHNFHLSDE